MKTKNGRRALIFRAACLFIFTFILTVSAALAPWSLLAVRAGYIEYLGIGDGGISQLRGMPDTGISGTLQIILIITLGISIVFLCIILRTILKEMRSRDEDDR